MIVTHLAARLRLLRSGRAWRGACPSCGYADAFILTQREGCPLWWCAYCQDRAGNTAAVRRALGDTWAPPPQRNLPIAVGAGREGTAMKKARALALWKEARDLDGPPAEIYLATRGLPGTACAALRFHPAAPHPAGLRLPAMRALIRDALTGAPQAVHRTYLRPDGRGKTDADPPKASLGPVGGGAVMLAVPGGGTDVDFIIGEGIEVSLSASLFLGLPAWSAMSSSNLARLPLPPRLRRVIIAADPGLPGQRDAWQAASHWLTEGRAVRIATPNHPEHDFNDLTVARRTAAAQEISHG